MKSETLIIRKATAFRLNEDLLSRLKTEAKKENRSLNNFVESALMERVYRNPNKTTLAAIKEAQADLYLSDIDLTDMQSFLKSME